MRQLRFAAGGVLAAALLLVGCEDTNFDLSPRLVVDTISLATPRAGNQGLPSGLDITASGAGTLGGARFPERVQDAGQWDFVVRDRAGGIALVPARELGLDSRAALSPPIVGETYESLREAPGLSTFRSDTSFLLERGRVLVARSRLVSCGFGQDEQFAKLTPLEVDVAAGRVRLAITVNENCGDPRLAEDDE